MLGINASVSDGLAWAPCYTRAERPACVASSPVSWQPVACCFDCRAMRLYGSQGTDDQFLFHGCVCMAVPATQVLQTSTHLYRQS
ncbi:hypothetical protein PAHAL_6G086200 [Panicum hallii]|uniref:Uncharacterized protein n=1 Tax=Panicum hallii TaxID=206008 RepID=A0A2S3I1C2_9POAL|nr:hypothetical protein PAHAL_6G086200 [Panicum hallii]